MPIVSRLARVTCVLSILLLILPTPQRVAAEEDDEGTGQNGMKPPGDCSKQRHRELAKAVGFFCKTHPRSCEDRGLTCKELRLRWAYNVLCHEARRIIMHECFRGGDEGHRTQLKQDTQAREKCEPAMKDRGCLVPTEEEARAICQ